MLRIRGETKTMHDFFEIGNVITNFCNGFFGRDDYETKRCVLVTDRYAVFEYETGEATTLNYSETLDTCLRERGFGNWMYEE